MKNFKTTNDTKGTKIKDVIIDGKGVYLNLSPINLLKYAEFAKDADVNDPTIMLKLSEKLFMPESFERVSTIEKLEDFVTLMDLAVEEVQKVQVKVENSQKFKRVE